MTTGTDARTAFLVTSYLGQPGASELHRRAEAGLVPRTEHVELARRFSVDVVDSEYMATGAAPVARALARRAGIPLGQVCEALLRGGQYTSIWAWSDRTGLPLSLLYKLSGSHRDLVLVTAWPSRPKKALLLRAGHTSIRAIICGSRAQLDFAATELGVPAEKLHFYPWPVDDRFWRPDPRPPQDSICAVGWEARDYSTLLAAVEGLDVAVELAVGTFVLSLAPAAKGGDRSPFGHLKGTAGYRMSRDWMRDAAAGGLPSNVSVHEQLSASELRDLYVRARFVVVPLHDVDSDCGITTITEAWAMGKAVIATRVKGHVDLMEHGREGLYVPPYDVSALRGAIDHLLRHPDEADRMGKAGRALVEARHSLDDGVERLALHLRPEDAHLVERVPYRSSQQ